MGLGKAARKGGGKAPDKTPTYVPQMIGQGLGKTLPARTLVTRSMHSTRRSPLDAMYTKYRNVLPVSVAPIHNVKQPQMLQTQPRKQLANRKGKGKGACKAPCKAFMRPPKKTKPKAPGEAALAEIRKFQKTTELFIPKIAFRRLLTEITDTIKPDLRWGQGAREALQEGVEDHLITRFSKSLMLCIHRERVTLTCKDMDLAYKVERIEQHPIW